ncbi:hypothetical protein IHE45_19G178000 [Dioscorea alata]|uniref:Uncharacterized protein n=1 Tax=Dioscorea alata TaxID=55571 RepID=A0ACB7U3U0_DIOAL|nr:hypothetical protein IHE45_19G178000 [Dioscorea alata]
MKPPQLSGEGTWSHEMKRTVGDKLRKAYSSAMVHAEQMTCQKRADDDLQNCGELDRRKGWGFEDPIRKVMFLGPWSHT